MRTLAALLLFAVFTSSARAQQKEPWLKAGDVVALVGGEDMVALAEEGWLETLVTWAQPQDRIRWRSLAWEGDTVFEQRRDLNYPTLETQLDRMGATVVICQFGKMESFAGKEGVAAFTEAYEKLLARLSGEKESRLLLDKQFDPERWSFVFDIGGMELVKLAFNGTIKVERHVLSGEKKRRIALVLPFCFGVPAGDIYPNIPDLTPRNADLGHYMDAIRSIGGRIGARVIDARPDGQSSSSNGGPQTLDGIHPGFTGSIGLSISFAEELGLERRQDDIFLRKGKKEMIRAIRAKNRLWFHYTRPQNWAFLAGNRTNQPSSRDHLDPTKRWFPEEMEQWVPLIEAKEKEIWALAAAPR